MYDSKPQIANDVDMVYLLYSLSFSLFPFAFCVWLAFHEELCHIEPRLPAWQSLMTLTYINYTPNPKRCLLRATILSIFVECYLTTRKNVLLPSFIYFMYVGMNSRIHTLFRMMYIILYSC